MTYNMTRFTVEGSILLCKATNIRAGVGVGGAEKN